MRLPIVLPIALLLALTGIAEAQPGMTPPGQTAPNQQQYTPSYVQYPQQQPTRTVSYGTHVFLTDLATWAVLGASADSDIAGIAVAGLFLGGPIVHLAHGNNSGAIYSLVARTALPFGGAALLSAGCDEDGDDGFECLGQIIAGAMLGYAGALAIDWFHLAKKTEVVAMPTGWASLRPSLNVTTNGAQAGLGMSF